MLKVLLGDSREKLKELDDNSIDLIFTSPPYADKRKGSYGGIPPENYVEWFLPIAKELLRVLKPTGSFVLNIKEGVYNRERSTYVIELILALKRDNWIWTDEYIWHKSSVCPGRWSNRFRDAWERLLHFNKDHKFNMYQEDVMVPVADSTRERMSRLRGNDFVLQNSVSGSGFAVKRVNMVGRDKAFPTNVLHLSTETRNKLHPAVFPVSLPTWFIKLFTKEGDLVLDPFVGSGTTLWAARALNRDACGIELKQEYYDFIREKIDGLSWGVDEK